MVVALANDAPDDPNTTADERLAVQTALEDLGYIGPLTATATQRSDATLVFYKTDFPQFATVLAGDLGIPSENVVPHTGAVLAGEYDAAGDVVLVIGKDWPVVISINSVTTTTQG